jgi:glycosyltransferase involved in cell wall biosynthesis
MAEQRRPVKILRLIARLNTGGPAIHSILLTQGLNGGRFTSRLITGTVSAGEGDMGYFAESRGVFPIVIPDLGREISLFKDLRALWRIYRIFCAEKPDIIHTHTAKAGSLGRLAGVLYNLIVLCLGHSRRAKLVHTFHGHVFHGYFSPWKSRLMVLVERLLALLSHRIVAVSETVKVDLVEVYKICRGEKVRVIPIGLDLSWVDDLVEHQGALREEFHIPPHALTVGIIGRLTPIKNHRFFFTAARSFQRDDLRFVAVGDGELRGDLQQMVRGLGLEGRVVFTGWQKEPAKIYADLDVVCLTSLNEGTPVSLIEAMAAGRPFVATDVGGVRDLMVGCQTIHPSGFLIFSNGILVSPDDPVALSEAIAFLAASPGDRHAMGTIGQKWATERCSGERLLQEIEMLYVELLGSQV